MPVLGRRCEIGLRLQATATVVPATATVAAAATLRRARAEPAEPRRRASRLGSMVCASAPRGFGDSESALFTVTAP